MSKLTRRQFDSLLTMIPAAALSRRPLGAWGQATEPIAAATTTPRGSYEPTWESIKANYQVPEWFRDAKFGLFIHWGVFAVPAHVSESYSKQMYGNNREITRWHAENYGSQDQFGYKNFVPLFKAEKFDPNAWAELFRRAGARYVIPPAEHHDGFAMWDSTLTRWDAKDMGPNATWWVSWPRRAAGRA